MSKLRRKGGDAKRIQRDQIEKAKISNESTCTEQARVYGVETRNDAIAVVVSTALYKLNQALYDEVKGKRLEETWQRSLPSDKQSLAIVLYNEQGDPIRLQKGSEFVVICIGTLTGGAEEANNLNRIGVLELYDGWFEYSTAGQSRNWKKGRMVDGVVREFAEEGPRRTLDVFSGSSDRTLICFPSDRKHYREAPQSPPGGEEEEEEKPLPKRHEGVRLTTDTGKARLLGARADGSATQVEMSGCRSDGDEEDESCLRVRNFTSSSYGIDTTVRSLQAFRELEVVALLARHVEGGLERMDEATRAQVQNASQRIAAHISAFNAARTLARTAACVPAASASA